jgi:putative ABC transport system substrate-binding protein
MNVDVIVAGTTAAALAAKGATGTIPIVFAVAADPVGVGLVASLARPGGNATGLTTANVDIIPKRLQLLTEIARGKVTRVAVLFNPADASNVIVWRNTQEAAAKLGISVRAFAVKSAEDYEPAFSAMAADHVDAAMVAAGALTDSHAGQLAALAARFRVPAMYGARGFVQAGGLVSYSASFSDNYRRAAGYVHKILKGAEPGDLPVEQANRFELAINLRTARELGLNLAPSFRLRADFVVE